MLNGFLPRQYVVKRVTLKAPDLDVMLTPFLASTVCPLGRANASSYDEFPAGGENSPGANETVTPLCFEQQFAFLLQQLDRETARWGTIRLLVRYGAGREVMQAASVLPVRH